MDENLVSPTPPAQTPPPVVHSAPQPEPHRRVMAKGVLLGVVGMLVLGALGAFAYFFVYAPRHEPMGTPLPTPWPSGEPMPSGSYSPLPEPVDVTEYEGLVQANWYGSAQSITPGCPGGPDCSMVTYVVGEIASDPYRGSLLYLDEEQSIGAFYQHFTVDANGNRINLKSVHGITDVPELIPFPIKAGYRLKKSYGVGTFFKDLKNPQKVFTDPIVGDVYLVEEWDCFFVKLPDQTALAYDLELPFMNPENGDLHAALAGVDSSESYEASTLRGCGSLCITYTFVDPMQLLPATRLEPIGTTNTGETLRRIRDPNDQVLRDLYNDESTVAYYSDDFQSLSQSKYTYEQFIAYHPLLYWQDPMGRWIEFKNKRFLVAAEMCKPVIYLYPQTTTDLSVKVHPNGGFLFTDPAYGEGWNVRADPQGNLTDLRTGKQHEYLFWEGIGLNYPRTNEGWVVSRQDVGAFIDEKLAALGLRGRELQDFREYWTSRLTERNYYKLSFLTQEQFNQIAPLEVSQTPDTATRILMTAEGLDEFRSIPPQILEAAPMRAGFTLIEWGGVVLK